jgi:hypothetical protein
VNSDGIWLRVLGTLVLAISLMVFETGSQQLWQSLLLPLVMAAAALALVQNLAAVAFGTLILATIHSDLSATHWVPSLAYPAIAIAAAIALVTIATLRFRQTIASTRDARWANRDTPRD